MTTSARHWTTAPLFLSLGHASWTDPALAVSDTELKQPLDLQSRALAPEKQARIMVEAQYKNIKAFWLQDVGKCSVYSEMAADCGGAVTEGEDDYDMQ